MINLTGPTKLSWSTCRGTGDGAGAADHEDRADRPEYARSARERDRRLSAVSPAAAALFTDLEASGPASASDPGLLARHGWTRSRAAQLLRELLDVRLVETTTVRNGPGRPRTVYAAVTVRP